jgi:hypothetical protein
MAGAYGGDCAASGGFSFAVESAVLYGEQNQEGIEKAVHDKSGDGLLGAAGMAETGAERRASRSEDNMDRADEIIYSAGVS